MLDAAKAKLAMWETSLAYSLTSGLVPAITSAGIPLTVDQVNVIITQLRVTIADLEAEVAQEGAVNAYNRAMSIIV
jgi:hypothetical protein